MPTRERPIYTPPPPRPWAELREILLQREAGREHRGRGLNHALTTASWLHLLAVVFLFASLIALVLGDVWGGRTR